MDHRPLKFPSSKRVVLALCALIVLATGSVNVRAQPGERRTREQIRHDFEARIASAEQEIREWPDKYYLYEVHGGLLTEILRVVDDRSEQDSMADRAFADFAAYERFTKSSALDSIAHLHETLWNVQAPNPWRDEIDAAVIQAFRENPHFYAAVEAYEELIRQQAEANKLNPENPFECRACQTLSEMYLRRARFAFATPDTSKAMSDLSAVWLDFAKAVEYEKQYVGYKNIFDVTNIYLQQAQDALTLEQYRVAARACEDADDFLKERFERYCEWNGAAICDSMMKGHREWSSTLKAKAYVGTGEYEKAIANADYFLKEGPLYGNCKPVYLVRAEAYRKLGNEDAAMADEKAAARVDQVRKCRSTPEERPR